MEKGYDYFLIIITLLKRLGYINCQSLLPTGIEVYTTDITKDEIDDGLKPSSPLHALRMEFDELERIKKMRLACMNIFSVIRDKKERENFIEKYFQCENAKNYFQLLDEFVSKTKLDEKYQEEILSELNEEALLKAETNLNEEQRLIYNQPVNKNVNVLAGPGSGKTHVLTLRCAKIIYREKVDPSQILVLAYNRAVVVELRNRLDELFGALGLSRFAHKIPAFTFHGLAKRCMQNLLQDTKTEEWDRLFKEYLSENANSFKKIFPEIKHILVDEFQDLTQNRLEYLKKLHTIFPKANFFTIGDINQSIYGFDRIPREEKEKLTTAEYAQMLNPSSYYKIWRVMLDPAEFGMRTNYRSYQKILDFAARYLPKNAQSTGVPSASQYMQEHEPLVPYVFEEEIRSLDLMALTHKVADLLQWAKAENASGDAHRRIRTVAIFFRTNKEVYLGYSELRKLIAHDVRIRIQGSNIGELWRKREMYELIHYLSSENMKNVELDVFKNLDTNNKVHSYGDIREILRRAYKKKSEWDIFYFQILEALIHNYIDSIHSDEKKHTLEELAEYIKDIGGNDDGGQIYKINDKYHKDDKKIDIILTTMHKVKGLEFDAVLITPSHESLPLNRFSKGSKITEADQADMDEEDRLMFVACTRAKKYLHVLTGPREKCLQSKRLYFPQRDPLSTLYFEKNPSLENYVLYYNASSYNYANFEKIKDIPIRSPAWIKKSQYTGYNFYEIFANGCKVGQLSGNSFIRKTMENNGINQLNGFFVSDVVAWTYEESLQYDQKNNTTFSKKWCDDAKKRGYIYIVVISGMGSPQ